MRVAKSFELNAETRDTLSFAVERLAVRILHGARAATLRLAVVDGALTVKMESEGGEIGKAATAPVGFWKGLRLS